MGSATTVPVGVASWQREGLAASVEGAGEVGGGGDERVKPVLNWANVSSRTWL